MHSRRFSDAKTSKDRLDSSCLVEKNMGPQIFQLPTLIEVLTQYWAFTVSSGNFLDQTYDEHFGDRNLINLLDSVCDPTPGPDLTHNFEFSSVCQTTSRRSMFKPRRRSNLERLRTLFIQANLSACRLTLLGWQIFATVYDQLGCSEIGL